MDTNPKETAEVPEQPSTGDQRKGSWGGLIGILLIVVVIIIGAFYTWGERIALQEARHAQEAAQP